MLETLAKPQVLTCKNPDDRDNEQETLTEYELGWLAGILDGEGCIALNLQRTHRSHPTLSPRVTVANTNPLIVSHICKLLDKIPISGHIEKRDNNFEKGEGRWKEAWVVQVSRLDTVRELLRVVLPYLIGKKAQAELLMRFIDIRLSVRSQPKGKDLQGWNYTDEEIMLSQQLSFLNKKGPVKGLLNDLTPIPSFALYKKCREGEDKV